MQIPSFPSWRFISQKIIRWDERAVQNKVPADKEVERKNFKSSSREKNSFMKASLLYLLIICSFFCFLVRLDLSHYQLAMWFESFPPRSAYLHIRVTQKLFLDLLPSNRVKVCLSALKYRRFIFRFNSVGHWDSSYLHLPPMCCYELIFVPVIAHWGWCHWFSGSWHEGRSKVVCLFVL